MSQLNDVVANRDDVTVSPRKRNTVISWESLLDYFELSLDFERKVVSFVLLFLALLHVFIRFQAIKRLLPWQPTKTPAQIEVKRVDLMIQIKIFFEGFLK